MTDAIGLDLGGSSLRAVSGSDLAGPLGRRPVGRDTTVPELVRAVGQLLDELDPARGASVVLAVPTFVEDDGTLLDTPAVPALTGVRLASVLAEALDRPTPILVPDLAAAAVGESRLGCGRGVHSFLCVALGTGANAAATRGGRLVETAYGCLGDAGHVPVEPDGPACPCGGRGCLEAVASGWALQRESTRLGLSSPADLVPAERSGNTAAGLVLDRAGVALGRAISAWSVLLWPDVVAVGGGVAALGERLLGPARAELLRLGPPYVTRRVQVVLAELGDRATVTGAALLARDAT